MIRLGRAETERREHANTGVLEHCDVRGGRLSGEEHGRSSTTSSACAGSNAS
jgi:hypothetical protein